MSNEVTPLTAESLHLIAVHDRATLRDLSGKIQQHVDAVVKLLRETQTKFGRCQQQRTLDPTIKWAKRIKRLSNGASSIIRNLPAPTGKSTTIRGLGNLRGSMCFTWLAKSSSLELLAATATESGTATDTESDSETESDSATESASEPRFLNVVPAADPAVTATPTATAAA